MIPRQYLNSPFILRPNNPIGFIRIMGLYALPIFSLVQIASCLQILWIRKVQFMWNTRVLEAMKNSEAEYRALFHPPLHSSEVLDPETPFGPSAQPRPSLSRGKNWNKIKLMRGKGILSPECSGNTPVGPNGAQGRRQLLEANSLKYVTVFANRSTKPVLPLPCLQ